MKKKILFILAIIMLICMEFTIVNAAEPTVTVKTDKIKVKPGDEFTITINATCEDGINGLSANYIYDKEQLEFVKGEAGEKFTSLSGDDEIAAITNTTDTLKEAEVYKLTFKVKNSKNVSASVKVLLDKIMLDSDQAVNSAHNMNKQEINLKVEGGASINSNTEVYIWLAIAVIIIIILIVILTVYAKNKNESKEK